MTAQAILRTVKDLLTSEATAEDETANPLFWSYLNDKTFFSKLPEAVLNATAQGQIVEENLTGYDFVDWRHHFSSQLKGKGLEIGPLHRPMLRHPGQEIDYIDRCTVKELREHYPELQDFPLVEPTIIGDAQTLENVPSRSFDFVIAAHVIEHMKNPLGAIEAWCRVCKQNGLLYLIVPDKRAIFDKQRLRTTLEHLILDYQEPSDERDYEHFLDYAHFVHHKSGRDAIIEADRRVREDYSIHFHTFIPTDVKKLLEWFSEHVAAIRIAEGPCMSPGSDEFHLLIQVL